MYYSDIFYLLTIVLFIVSLIASGVVKSRFRTYAKERTANGMTGAMAAERILRANGISDVEKAVREAVEETNKSLPHKLRVERVHIRKEPFEMTSTMKVKRGQQ